jgi:hypothetical protein
VVLGLLWTLAAVKAGLFITDRHAAASNPHEEPMESFSKNKKFIDVNSWRVAYIDEGSGEPVLISVAAASRVSRETISIYNRGASA